MYYLVSILFGLIPEVLYFTLFITYTKNIKEKRIKLFLLISIAYFLCLLIQQFVTIYYFALIFIIYAIIKMLYKQNTQIIDIFIISIMCLWITLLSFVMMLFLSENYSNYWILYALNRIFLFLPFVFKNKFNLLYKKYYHYWNRNDNEKRPIKSITLRNISLILLNSFVFFMNITIINMINYINKGGV